MAVITRPTITDDSGTFIDGTVFNNAFFGNIFDQIDDQAHSTTGFDLYEVIRTVWSQTGAVTATQGTLDFSNFPLVSTEGEAFIARIGSSTDITAQNLNAVGIFAQKSQ